MLPDPKKMPKLRGPKKIPHVCCAWFKSQHQSSCDVPFPTPPTISHSCQHFHIFLALLGCQSNSGQVRPCGEEPIISKLLRRHCNQGELPPSYILGWSYSHPPGSKQATVFNISMKPIKGYRYVKLPSWRVSAQLLLFKTTLNGPAPWVPSPSSGVGVRTSYIYFFFLIFPGHWVLYPITNPYLGSPSASPCYVISKYYLKHV